MIGELMIADEGVLDYRKGVAMKVSVRQNETIAPIRVNIDHPYISTIAAIAPSPDWFSGFYDFDMIDPSTDTWYDKVVIETFPWDAGTDSGTTYESQDDLTIPPYLITQLTPRTVPESGVFLSSDGDVLPVSRWTCSRVEPPRLRTTSGVTLSSLVITVLLLVGATAVIL